MEEIKNIIFDFGAVLVDWNPRYLYRNHFSDERLMEHFLREICNDEWNMEQDRGRSFSEAVALLQAKYPAYHDLIALYDTSWESMLGGEISGTVDVLKKLKNHYSVFGLTNWSAEKIQVAYDKFHFFEYFDGIVVSGAEKIIKPDPRIYQLLLRRFGINANETVFIDDNIYNINTARGLGIHSIHFTTPENLSVQLKDYGIDLEQLKR